MERQEIFDKVKKLITEKMALGEIEVREESNLSYDLCLDSLDMVELTIDAEKEFGMSIPDQDAAKFVTVKDIVDYIVEEKQ